ncbi:MAG: winged helix-turn-helix domain-containing protein [Hyphomicrobiaceae bacterium]|jgi:two-component system phosphate regulon response regulator OmpR
MSKPDDPRHASAPLPMHVVLAVPRQAGTALAGALSSHGYRVTTTTSQRQARFIVEQNPAGAIVIDISAAADEEPLALIHRLAGQGPIHILALTASADAVDRIVALQAGADDCLALPVEPREVVARLAALRRRRARTLEEGRLSAGGGPRALHFGRMMLDLDAGCLFGPEGRELPVTRLELELLRTFAANPNRVLNRDQLSELAHGRVWSPLDRSLDIRISRLRAKIEPDPAHPRHIVTVRGIGYRFAVEARASA